MRKVKLVMIGLATAIILGGCSFGGKNNDNIDTSNKTTESSSKKVVAVKDEPLTNFESIKGKVWMLDKQYAGSAVASFDDVNWKDGQEGLSLTFLSNTEGFIGKYENNKLLYGRTVEILKPNKYDFVTFNHADFVASQDYINKLTDAEQKESFTALNSNEVPGSTNGVNYLQSNEFKKDSYKAELYRFYKTKNGDLIRQNPTKNGKVYYSLYKIKK